MTYCFSLRFHRLDFDDFVIEYCRFTLEQLQYTYCI